MGRSAGNSWRLRAGSLVMLAPMLALAACASQDDEMAQKLAAAEAAANRAVAAQQAAEKAAASVRAAPAPEPTVLADAWDKSDEDDESASPEISLGDESAAASPDGAAIPGQGT